MSELLKLGTKISRISAIIRKEISNLITDKVALFILFIIPVVMISVVGGSKMNANLADVTIWIIDLDNSQTSREVSKTMMNGSLMGDSMGKGLATYYGPGDMAPVEPELGETEAYGEVNITNAEKTLPTQYLDCYVVLPTGFEQELAETGKAHVLVYYDAIDIKNRFIADAMVTLGFTEVQIQNMLFERDVFFYPEFRPNNIADSINILELGAPMLIGIMLFFSINLICTQCIVGDIPLQRLLTTPVFRSEVITGKILSYTIISIFQIIISMLLMGAFKVTMKSLWIELFILLLINSIASVSMGVFISTISKTRLQASQMFLMFFFVMLIMAYYVRNPIFLDFLPLEQTRICYSQLAFRGSSILDIIWNLIRMSITGFIFYILTIIYITRYKKEFV